jgi:hypothetical protein
MKEEAAENMGIGDVLKARLRSNEPVLEHLPEVIDILHIDIQVDCSSPSCKKIVFLGVCPPRFLLPITSTSTPGGPCPDNQTRCSSI